jgi:hypothetical protein
MLLMVAISSAVSCAGGVRAARPVVERAAVREAAPGVEASRREPQDAQGNGERDGLLSGSDGRQDRALGLAVVYTLGIEAEAGEANQEEGEPDDGEEESDAPPEGKDLGLKLGMVKGEYLGRDDGPRTAPNPTDGRGAWNTEVMEQTRVALFADEVAHPMVVGTAAGGGRHGAW